MRSLARILIACIAAGRVAAAADVAPGRSADLGQMVHDHKSSLVFIEGGGGAGSGFVCRMKDGVFVVTNQHVLAGMPTVKLTRLDSTRIAAGTVQAAVAHDIMRLATADSPDALPAMEDVDAGARIGDDIAVLGNSEGARVIQPLAGKLLGIGPDRIEVSAEFLPGNSGSPIIHLKTGTVIGVATYLTTGQFAEFTDSRRERVRRFGFRLDSVKTWQAIDWRAYQAEREQMDRIGGLTQDLIRLIGAMQQDAPIDPGIFRNTAISRPVKDFQVAMGKGSLSPPDRARVVQNFLAALRSATQGDIMQAKARFRYDFFRRAVTDEAKLRDQMHELFDKLLKARR
jgi:Trypsin-like peptidase domain